MVREIIIAIYLFIFRMIFNGFKLFPQKKKTVCVASFGDNIFYTANSLRKISDEPIIILRASTCKYPFDPTICKIIPFQMLRPFSYILSIYHLATARTILIDNYYGFLAATDFKPETTCIQLWHAAGALKQFGLTDSSIIQRGERAKQRFQNVYKRFHYTIVGSEHMATTFRRSFGVPNERIIRTGIPRTDIFFYPKEQKAIHEHLLATYPAMKGKKVILYAPTYRDDQLSKYSIPLDVNTLYQQFGEDYVLFIKNHPAVTYELDSIYEDFMIDVSDYYDSNHLLLISDILITDYSSIPFEYALLHKPMIFYTYDYEDYKKKRGLPDNYINEIPGSTAHTTDEIVAMIKENKFEIAKITSFSNRWNRYSNGNSSMNVARFIVGLYEQQQLAK